MSYFDHSYASNSELKEIVARSEGRQKPDNIQLIYDMGTETHAGILERHKMRNEVTTSEQKELIDAMAKRFWADKMCRDIMMMPDFRREHEFYRSKRYGLEGVKCKVDGESRRIRTILELKGLSVSTENAFKDSVLHMNYDQGAAFYIDTATGYIRYEQKLIVGMSKKDPDLLFKMLINREHPYYKSGLQKVGKAVTVWKQMGFR